MVAPCVEYTSPLIVELPRVELASPVVVPAALER